MLLQHSGQSTMAEEFQSTAHNHMQAQQKPP